MTRGKKVLIGCLVGLGVVVLSVVVLAFFFFSWIQRPGEPLAGERLVDPDTGFYLEITLPKDLSASRDLVRALLEAQNQPPSELGDDAPALLTWLLPRLPEQKVSEDDIDKILPLTLIATSQTDPIPTADHVLLTVNIPSMGNALRSADWMMSFAAGSEKELTAHSHGDEEYFSFHGPYPLWFSIVATDILLAVDETALSSGIDRLGRIPGELGATPLSSLLSSLPSEAVLRMGALQGQSQILLDLLAGVAPGLADLLSTRFPSDGDLKLWARLDTANILSGEFETQDQGAAIPETQAEQPGKMTLTLSGQVRFTLEPAFSASSGTRRWKFQVEGIETLMRQAILSDQIIQLDQGQ